MTPCYKLLDWKTQLDAQGGSKYCYMFEKRYFLIWRLSAVCDQPLLFVYTKRYLVMHCRMNLIHYVNIQMNSVTACTDSAISSDLDTITSHTKYGGGLKRSSRN